MFQRQMSMSRDLFILAKDHQGRSNPIVTALLYDYCQAAAYWYLRNCPVEDVFDVVWKALEDYQDTDTGKSLIDYFTKYGLDTLLPEIRYYFRYVDGVRAENKYDIKAPEASTSFKSGRPREVYGLQAQLENLGGSWRNVQEYARIWGYVIDDWEAAIQLRNDENARKKFKLFNVSLSAPGVNSKLRVHFPVWGWEVTVSRVTNIYLGLLVSDLKQDPLRFALIYNADLSGDKPWPGGQRPFLYALDRKTGEAEPMNLGLSYEYELGMVMHMYRAARVGPNFPTGLQRGGEACFTCGYRKMCYGEKIRGDMQPSSLAQLLQVNKREREFLMGFVGKRTEMPFESETQTEEIVENEQTN